MLRVQALSNELSIIKKYSLELLLEEYSELVVVRGWNLLAEWLTAKSFCFTGS